MKVPQLEQRHRACAQLGAQVPGARCQQAGAGIAGETGPGEALPALLLIEAVMFFAIVDEGGLHQVAYRFGPQFETQAHAAVGVQYVGQGAELVDRGEKLRVETQALAMARIRHLNY